jgi:heme/copper-type cytochrome/quinol oxidase subunit 2
MGFLEATILFVTGLIAFAVLLPVGVELIPDMQNTMGSTVTLLISAMFVIILVAAFVIYVRQSQEPDRYLGGGETYP